jgi:hypothetical protein
MCLPNSQLAAAISIQSGISDSLDALARQGGWLGPRLDMKATFKLIWNERQSGGRRIIRINCESAVNVLGQQMGTEMIEALFTEDQTTFIQFELAVGRLISIRRRLHLSDVQETVVNETRTKRFETGTCNPGIGQGETVLRDMTGTACRVDNQMPFPVSFRPPTLVGLVPWPEQRYEGKWTTLQRGEVMADVYNTAYTNGRYGENGFCGGGALDVFIALGTERNRRVTVGRPLGWN